jgi:hypothetical protein
MNKRQKKKEADKERIAFAKKQARLSYHFPNTVSLSSDNGKSFVVIGRAGRVTFGRDK